MIQWFGRKGKHSKFVFSYRGHSIKQFNTRAWRNALKKTGIQDFGLYTE